MIVSEPTSIAKEESDNVKRTENSKKKSENIIITEFLLKILSTAQSLKYLHTFPQML